MTIIDRNFDWHVRRKLFIYRQVCWLTKIEKAQKWGEKIQKWISRSLLHSFMLTRVQIEDCKTKICSGVYLNTLISVCVCVICQKQKKHVIFLSWTNFMTKFDRFEHVLFCFCHKIYDKISCSTTFVFCCSEKETERTHLPCNVLWFFWRRWFRYCFLDHYYCLPSAIGEARAPWYFLVIFYMLIEKS